MTETSPTVAIAGGGLAGLAAACALSDAGFRVTLFEKRPFLGGRASSYEHPGTGEVVDNCQHVLFRLCTNLVEFYERIGVANHIRWYDRMTFIEPGGRISTMQSSFLPAPLHTAPSFFGFHFLSAADKLAVARALMPLTVRVQPDTGKSFQQWLQAHGQTQNAIARFWRPILVSALSEELDRISISAAAQVVRESMKSRAARHMGVPTVPLTDLYNAAGDYVRARGGVLHFRCPVENFAAQGSQVQVQVRGKDSPAENPPEEFDYLVIALPFDALDRILPQAATSEPLREKITHFENSPITGIHLWFDRQISDLDHAVLLDRTIQWMFHKSRLQPVRSQNPNGSGSYIELVVSSSKTLIDKSRGEIVDLALAEVREFFPAARPANLVKSTVIKEVNATYSPRPGIDVHRPTALTAWPRVFLAGDWTATGWPATMEGAVRSGYLAAEAVAGAAGIANQRFLSPDLPASGLMRLFPSA
ncbi:MAG TPA: hydroxysqualene dehydroxylase HpnE [Candidatus Sulfotelmatobacter sp.]|nr:hydroxysqualene dehydroxylase HpnE [Candidatus Sulfotelmatobacter sp.]